MQHFFILRAGFNNSLGYFHPVQLPDVFLCLAGVFFKGNVVVPEPYPVYEIPPEEGPEAVLPVLAYVPYFVADPADIREEVFPADAVQVDHPPEHDGDAGATHFTGGEFGYP